MPIAAKQMPLDLIDGGAFVGVLQRGTGAFVAAFLMIAVAWRRKDQIRGSIG